MQNLTVNHVNEKSANARWQVTEDKEDQSFHVSMVDELSGVTLDDHVISG